MARGAGRVEKDECLKVSILPGAVEGMAGLLNPVPKGAPGDLYVIVASAPHARLARSGADHVA